jgi:DNA-binding HxlR family transcriptional regulator
LVFITLKTNGTLRFSEIRKSIGDISQRMLTVTLRSLEEDGFVKRKIYPEVPPRVEYSLSDLGRSLMPPLENLLAWTLENQERIMGLRKAYRIKSARKLR